jgi:hypothetical protein
MKPAAAKDADLRAFQAVRLEVCRVVRLGLAVGGLRRVVVRVDAGQYAEQCRGIGDRPGDRAGRVLRRRDGEDSVVRNSRLTFGMVS